MFVPSWMGLYQANPYDFQAFHQSLFTIFLSTIVALKNKV